MKILVVRHGRTNWNDLNKVQGLADIELNEEGKSQAKITAEKLKNEKIDLIISSPLTRTKQTAEIVRDGRDINIIFDDRLKERDYGEFEGLTKEIFKFPDFWTYSKNIKYEKAENIQDFFGRVFEFLDELKMNKQYEEKTVLLVIHGGVSVAISAYFEGLPEEGEPTKNVMKNCEIREFYL